MWNKIWIWVKSYWYIPIIAILAIFAFFAGRSDWVIDLFKKARQSSADQIATIEALAKKEKEEKEKLQKQYEVAVAALEAQYAVDGKKLQEEEKKIVKELVMQYKDKPEELTDAVALIFGFKVVK